MFFGLLGTISFFQSFKIIIFLIKLNNHLESVYNEYLKTKTNRHTIFQDSIPNEITKIANLELIFILHRIKDRIIPVVCCNKARCGHMG